MDLLDRLLGHDTWTTARLLAQSHTLTDAQLDQPFEIGWGTVRRTFAHVIDNMETWVDLMRGGPLRVLPEPAAQWETLEALEARLRVVAPELAALARAVQADGRWDEQWTDFLDDPPVRKTFGGGIAHVLTHSMHHRAQLIHMLRRLGVRDVVEGDALSWEAAAPQGTHEGSHP
ncbi:DinB family protein [Deinococcus maricopensis]|uniref:DinB family protein n=1 Tax=Deinococcus maricopensis (strain DSM 21211 / LMG 22137 / NRRL B-23946 / LB-34) TaxID=709986 RepID=E8U5F8_DEIML|nr:DinB family protein [Deinococcus maricopensis]ADV66297.1 DinB family protein [Deinococcus maricopensis DSM 21211]